MTGMKSAGRSLNIQFGGQACLLRPFFLLAVLMSALVTFGCGENGPGSASQVEAQTPEESRAEFTAVCESIRSSTEQYYGLGQIEILREYLDKPSEDPRGRLIVRARLGTEYLRVGATLRGAELLAEAHDIAVTELPDDLPFVQDVTRRAALGFLRLAEVENCIERHGPTSCLLPLDRAAQHQFRRGSENAIRYYLEYLQSNPDPDHHALATFLMNIAAMTLGEWPDHVPPELAVPVGRMTSDDDIGRFPNIAEEVGIHLQKPSGGSIVEDFDGDGLLDILTSTIDPCGTMVLYRNNGEGGFDDISIESRVDTQLGGLNMMQADYDNDGDVDVLVLRGGWMGEAGRMRNSLLRNDGTGRFEDVTHASGLAEPVYPTQSAGWADYDLDGDLDLYIGNEANDAGKAYPAQLFRNEGDGTFSEVAEEAGVTNDRLSKASNWGDYDNDGDPDIYVSNIGPNRLYRNNGDGTFTDVATVAGVEEPVGRGFTTWFFDYDNDGHLDILAGDYNSTLGEVAAWYLGVDIPSGRPLIHHNQGDGTFREVGAELGILAPCLPMGGNYGDLDNDGWLDFYLGTGTPSYESIAPNLMYRNQEGKRFADVTYSGGFGNQQKGHGIAFGDLDNDGDQDIFEQMGGAYPGDAFPSSLFENPGHGNAWITLKLVGLESNRFGVGARIRVVAETPAGERTVHVLVGSGGSFGGSSLIQEIGLGDAFVVRRIEIDWPGGSTQILKSPPIKEFLEIEEGRSRFLVLDKPTFRLGGVNR